MQNALFDAKYNKTIVFFSIKLNDKNIKELNLPVLSLTQLRKKDTRILLTYIRKMNTLKKALVGI